MQPRLNVKNGDLQVQSLKPDKIMTESGFLVGVTRTSSLTSVSAALATEIYHPKSGRWMIACGGRIGGICWYGAAKQHDRCSPTG
jgi:hypothetical protein